MVMKKIVICCDGTWNRLDGEKVTNVVRIAEAVSSRDAEGTLQVVYYDEGVGSGKAVAEAADRLIGGAFGGGLMTKVEQAYRFLVFNYDPGDEIFIFGFSRGAFTARSLAGLIRNCGIVEQAQARRIGEAIALYRGRGPESHPDSDASCAFRARIAPRVHLNDHELDWRRANLPGFREGASVRLRIRYLGVWDTVGALGVPNHLLLAGLFNRGHAFHDTVLSSSIESARHAVAIDEFRRAYEPALWSNLARLNASAEDPAEAPFRQEWFPGDHSSVGGGGETASLSSGALLWIAEGAGLAGLALEARALAEAREEADHRGPLRSKAKRFVSLETFMRKGPRRGPAALEDVSEPARRRWREPAANLHEKALYRPEALAGLSGDLARGL